MSVLSRLLSPRSSGGSLVVSLFLRLPREPPRGISSPCDRFAHVFHVSLFRVPRRSKNSDAEMMLFTLRTHALPSIRPLRCRDRAVCSFELFSRYTTAMRAIRRKTRGYDNEISADGHEHARDARTHSDLVRDARSTLVRRSIHGIPTGTHDRHRHTALLSTLYASRFFSFLLTARAHWYFTLFTGRTIAVAEPRTLATTGSARSDRL